MSIGGWSGSWSGCPIFLPRPISDELMLYDLSLHMGYIYDVPASGAHHVIRVLPLSIGNRQRLIAGSLTVSPQPDEQSNYVDFFRHPTTSIFVRNAHERLDIR